MNPIRIATSEIQPYEIAHTEAVLQGSAGVHGTAEK